MKLQFILIILSFLTHFSLAQKAFQIQDHNNIIHGTSFGQGIPLLIINGGPGMSSEGFKQLASELSENYQCIIYDQRGTGKSTVKNIDAEHMHIDSMLADIEKIRTYFGFEKWSLLGHSFGGMLASYYAVNHPERIHSLILSASGGIDLSLFNDLDIRSRLNQTQRDSLEYWTQEIRDGDTSYYARFQRGLYLAPAYLFDQSFVPTVAERLTQGNMQINAYVWQSMRDIDFDCSESLRDFDRPVLIIQGKQDILNPSIAKSTHKLLPNSQLIFLDNCAHYPWLESKENYYAQIHIFLGSS